MEKGIKTEIKWDYLGAELATLSDEEQSKFFIGFIKELQSWPHYNAEMQMLMVKDKLPEKIKLSAEDFLSNLWFKG